MKNKYILGVVILLVSLAFASLKFIPYLERINSSTFKSEQYAKEIAKQIAAAKRPLAKNALTLKWPVTNLAASGNIVLAGLPGGTYMISEDAGVSWLIKTTGDSNFDFTQAAIHPDGVLMLLSDRNNFEEHLLVSRDNGLSWKNISLGDHLPNKDNDIGSIVMSQTGMLLVDLGPTEKLYMSSDMGNTWQSAGSTYYRLFYLSRASGTSTERVTHYYPPSSFQEVAIRDAIFKKTSALLGSGISSPLRSLEDDDFAWSQDFNHWLHFKTNEDKLNISHDRGNTFIDAKITNTKEKTSNDPTTSVGSNPLESLRILASAISDDGTFAVAIFENEMKEMAADVKNKALGEDYSDVTSMEAPEKNYADINSRVNATGTRAYEVFVSRDSGASFKKIPTPITDYDIAGIKIIDSARGDFFVFQHGVSGVSRYQSSTGKFQNYPTGFHAVGAAALTSKGWLFAGTRLMALTPNGIEWLSETSPSAKLDTSK